MFACPVHSYINDLPLTMESMNLKIKIVYSVSLHSIMSVTIEPGVSFCIYIYVSRLKSDNVWPFNALLVHS